MKSELLLIYCPFTVAILSEREIINTPDTRSQLSFHAVSCRANVRCFTVRLAGPDCRTLLRCKCSLNSFKLV